ncbi:unnamed protein product [Cyprideis torosa]|uniref:Uncharacterized protein n=1 Tax=Cyprideis torosa TaxID=163714 RepID=A0A7R8W9M5_9CRUS|nr:unnamed protein product [Cyprideis torosa]CAG0885017.1 unnamed protein product [Cyprideis torosa]
MLSSFLRRSLLMGGPLVEKTSTVLVLSSSRCVHSTRVLWKMDEKVRDDRREMMKTMPKPDEGTPGETSLDMGFLRKADLFPDEDTPNQMFGGMLFKDIHIVDVRCSKNNTLMSCHTAGKSRDKVAYNSCSKEGFKNCRKATNVAAQATGISFARMLLEKGVRYIRVRIQGLGPGRVACLKGMQMGGLEVVAIMDVTPIQWTIATRPKKQRRL